MSQPRFLADEDLRFEIVLAVRRREPAVDIATAFELGRAGSTDAEICNSHRPTGCWSFCTMGTHSRHERKNESRTIVAGVFLTPQGRPSRAVAESIILIWAASEAEEWTNRVVFLPW